MDNRVARQFAMGSAIKNPSPEGEGFLGRLVGKCVRSDLIALDEPVRYESLGLPRRISRGGDAGDEIRAPLGETVVGSNGRAGMRAR